MVYVHVCIHIYRWLLCVSAHPQFLAHEFQAPMGAYSEQYGNTISWPTGRYGEDFVEKRREKLERWTNRVARHPVLSRSEVMGHFLLCDDEGVSEQWRVGRKPP